MKPETRVLPYLALAFGIVAIGMSGIFVKWANAPGAVNGFYRMAIAAAVLALPFALDAKRHTPLSNWHLLLAALGGLFFSCNMLAWNTAVLVGSVANSTLLTNTSPIWVGIGAMILFKEKLRPLFWGGLLLAMFGVAVILAQDLLLHPTFGTMDLLSLAAGFSYGMFFLAMERARDRLNSLVAWWVSATTSAAALLVMSIVFQQPFFGYSFATYANFVALALVTQVGGWLSVNYALGHLPASLVSPTLLGQPVVTAILAVLLLDQPLSATQIIGGVVILSGIWIVHRANPG